MVLRSMFRDSTLDLLLWCKDVSESSNLTWQSFAKDMGVGQALPALVWGGVAPALRAPPVTTVTHEGDKVTEGCSRVGQMVL